MKKGRKEKILAQLQQLQKQFTFTFDELERLRGRLVSISLVCPLSRLYTREMNRVLQIAEENLQVQNFKHVTSQVTYFFQV